MRIIYDDEQAPKVINLLHEFMMLYKSDTERFCAYEYNDKRVQPHIVKAKLNEFFQQNNFQIGKTVKHAHGIGNNCEYPVYFKTENELQECCAIHINCGLYGGCCVYITDYNNDISSKIYKLGLFSIKIA